MPETPLIDIRPDHWAIVRDILQRHVPQYAVWAFGSRAKWQAKEYSDLDLAIITDQPLPLDVSASLSDDFSESDLPWKVDVVDWATTSESFRKIIERDKVVVQEGKKGLGMAGEWPTSTVGAVSKRVTKGTTPTTIGGRFVNAGVAFVKAESITDDGRFDREKFAFVDDYTNQLLARSVLEEDDILFTIAGTIGRVARVPRDLLPANTNQAVAIIRPDPDVIDSRFLYYVLRDDLRIKHAHTRVVQSVQANFSLAELSAVEVPLPSKTEQRAIAHILGTLDDKIELNRKQNETLEAMARALFKAWFVDFEPVRAKMEGRWQRGQSLPGLPAHLYDLFPDLLVESELGEIPKGWEVTSLSEYSALNPESWTRRTRPAQIRYVDLSNTKRGRIESITNYESEDAPSRAQRVLRPLDTIIGTVRPGNGSYALVFDEGLTGSTGFAVIRPLRREYSELVYLAATARENIERLSNLADGGAYPAVRPEIVSATQVPRAEQEIINEFSQQVSPMFASIANNDHTSRTLTQLRDTLLPKLISGQLRVPDVEAFLKERGL